MKKLIVIALLIMVGLSSFAQWDVRNKIFRQIANGDTITQRIWNGYDTFDGTNPILVNYYDSVGFVGVRGVGIGVLKVYGNATVNGNTYLGDTTYTNTISPYSGTTTTFPQNLSVSGNTNLGNAATDTTLATGRVQISQGSLYIDSTSTTGLGAIYSGVNRVISFYRPPFTSGVRPAGDNLFLGISAGNLSMSGTTATHATNNIGIGKTALSSITSGSGNIVVGNNALNAMTTNTNNIAIGTSSLTNLTTGSQNICIGQESGRYFWSSGSSANLTSTTQSVYIGSVARASANANSNEIAIGHNVIGSGSNTATIGRGVTMWTTSASSINTESPTNLTISSSSNIAGGTANLNGGMLTLSAGQSKGTGIASIRLQSNTRAAASGTDLNTLVDRFIVPSTRIVANNSDSVIFTCTPLATDTTLYGNSVAGSIHYEVAVKGSDGYQSESGEINFTAVRYDGTVTATIGIDHERESLSSSTLVVTPSLTYVGGLWTVTINVNSGLTSPVVKFDYTVLKGTSAPDLIQK